MANYQELLTKAVNALPENNGAARREVYEKARKALVAQLRGIDPPLPAREITQHRLELEDCIREVENAATEAVLGGLKEVEETVIPLEEPAPVVPVQPPEPPVAEGEPATAEEEGSERAVADPPARDMSAVDEPAEQEPTENQEATEAEAGSGGAETAAPSVQASPENTKDSVTERLPEKGGQEKAAENGSGTPGEPVGKVADAGISEKADVSAAPKDPNGALDALIARAGKKKSVSQSPSGGKARVEPATGAVSAQDENKDRSSQPAVAAAPQADAGSRPDMRPEPEMSGDGGAAVDDLALALEQAQSRESFSTPSGTRSDQAVGIAMSRVREVGNEEGKGEDASPVVADVPVVDPVNESVRDADAQSLVDRAIQTLDQEARGGAEPPLDNGAGIAAFSADGGLKPDEPQFEVVDDEEERGGHGLTIFLVLVILLLGAAGGGGYWAWQQGFIDPQALFSSSSAPSSSDEGTGNVDVSSTPDAGDSNGSSDAGSAQPNTPIRDVTPAGGDTGPGNTATQVDNANPTDPNVALEDPNKSEDRLGASPSDAPDASGQTNGETVADAAAPDGNGNKVEDRLGNDTGEPALVQEGDGQATTIGAAQSLLLEAAPAGGSGAVPFSGTVSWSRGVDALGQPTLIGEANIPARNMGVKILIRRNADPSLPASHLMEIDFTVSETFIGGSVAGLPGILMKNEELVQGQALVGASARVVGNSFLFALSAADQDVRANLDLLKNRKWMDLALLYATGKRAIITLEKDDAAQQLFTDVMDAWAAEAASQAADTGPSPN